MNTRILVLIVTLSSVSVKGRLIHRNKTKVTEDIQTEKPNPLIRLTRNTDESILTGFSRDEMELSDEFIRTYNKQVKFYYNSKTTPNRTQAPRISRVERDSSIKIFSVTRTTPIAHDIEEIVLIKKPIPKFTDMDYGDDFQTKMNDARSVLVDASNNYEEDFSVGDYEFDVNHDEFASGKKDLGTRLSVKSSYKPVTPVSKIPRKLLTTTESQTTKISNTFSKIKKMLDISKEDEYYDDDTTTTTAPDKESDEYKDEDNSKEVEKKKRHAVRSIRSWNMNTYVNKNLSEGAMPKLFSVLPMFPQVI